MNPKEICKRCWERNPGLVLGGRERTDNWDSFWHDGICLCPQRNFNGLQPFPPKYCPYKTEMTVLLDAVPKYKYPRVACPDQTYYAGFMESQNRKWNDLVFSSIVGGTLFVSAIFGDAEVTAALIFVFSSVVAITSIAELQRSFWRK